MAQATQGAIRPTSAPAPLDLCRLNLALTVCDSVSAMLDNGIEHPHTLSPESLAILAGNLRDAANALDPSVSTAGGAA